MRTKDKYAVIHRASRQTVKHVDGAEAALKLIEKLDPTFDPDYGSELFSMEEVFVSRAKHLTRQMVTEAVDGLKDVTMLHITGNRRWRKGQASHEFTVGAGGRSGSFVNVYEVSRHYGGPEEGGWWYDWYELVKFYPAHGTRQIHNRCLKAARKFLDRAYGDIYSVNGGTKIVIRTEAEIGASATTHAPHYE